MKRILSVLSLLLLMLSLPACGGGDDTEDGTHTVAPVNCQATPSVCR